MTCVDGKSRTGRRGRPRGASQAPPIFDQRAFAKAVGIATTAIAHASAVGGQGGPSDLQMFMAHHHPSFRGGGDLMVANHWFCQVERVLEAMGITSDATRIRLATFKLEGESHIWWMLHLFRMMKLFPSIITKVVKHYITVGVHRSFPQGVVS